MQFHEPGVLKRDGPNFRHKEHDSLVYVTGKRYWYWNSRGPVSYTHLITNLSNETIDDFMNRIDEQMYQDKMKYYDLAYLMFNLYTPPCFAALVAMNSEMKSGKWLLGGICLQLATGYTVAFGVYQIGTLITTGSFGTAFIPGLIAVIVFALIILWRIRKSDKEFASEYSLHSVKS